MALPALGVLPLSRLPGRKMSHAGGEVSAAGVRYLHPIIVGVLSGAHRQHPDNRGQNIKVQEVPAGLLLVELEAWLHVLNRSTIEPARDSPLHIGT